MSCLSRDSSIRMTTIVSDSAADRAGRRNAAIQAKLRMPHVSKKQIRPEKSASVRSMIASAAACGAAMASNRQMLGAAAATAVREGTGLSGAAILTHQCRRGLVPDGFNHRTARAAGHRSVS